MSRTDFFRHCANSHDRPGVVRSSLVPNSPPPGLSKTLHVQSVEAAKVRGHSPACRWYSLSDKLARKFAKTHGDQSCVITLAGARRSVFVEQHRCGRKNGGVNLFGSADVSRVAFSALPLAGASRCSALGFVAHQALQKANFWRSHALSMIALRQVASFLANPWGIEGESRDDPNLRQRPQRHKFRQLVAQGRVDEVRAPALPSLAARGMLQPAALDI